MGWADCGDDSKGRPIGYGYPATCDESGCTEKIDRGLSYVCGTMHGEGEIGCEKYFCQEHRGNYVTHPADGQLASVCAECFALAIENGYDDESETWTDT